MLKIFKNNQIHSSNPGTVWDAAVHLWSCYFLIALSCLCWQWLDLCEPQLVLHKHNNILPGGAWPYISAKHSATVRVSSALGYILHWQAYWPTHHHQCICRKKVDLIFNVMVMSFIHVESQHSYYWSKQYFLEIYTSSAWIRILWRKTNKTWYETDLPPSYYLTLLQSIKWFKSFLIWYCWTTNKLSVILMA